MVVNNNEEDCPLNDDFSMVELMNAVKETKDTAPGKDCIKACMIQALPDIMFKFILIIYNEIWKKAIFPSHWYHCIQIPVLKPGKDPTSPNSYRPISLTPVLCKIMERMVKKRLMWLINKNNLLSPFQAGFRKNRSTLDQLVRLETDIHKGLINQEYVMVVFLDLEKAFNKLWRQGLIAKCSSLDIKGRMLNWIITFLKDRNCVVRIENTFSAEYVLEKGTPQGSIMSPVLFNLMLSDLKIRENEIKISIYADDIAIWSSNKNLTLLQRKMQRAIDEIAIWCSLWKVDISAQKSAVIVFSNKQKNDVDLLLDGNKIKQYTEYKFLGMWFDHKLTWKKHILSVKDKCTKRLNLLRCIAGTSWGGNGQILLLIYKGLIRSILDYGCELYDTACNSLKEQLDSIQYQALKVVTGAIHSTSLEALRVECGELPLKYRRSTFVDKYKFYLLSCNIEKHSTVEILQPKWNYNHFTWIPGRGPLMVRACTMDVEVEKIELCYPREPFWHYSSPYISYYIFNKINKKRDSNLVINNIVRERLDNRWKGFLQIYTDGSKLDDNRTGAAFYVHDLGISKFYSLSPISILRAELTAIIMALEWIGSLNQCLSAVILTDSLSALKLLDKLHPESVLIVQILYNLRSLQERDVDVTFEWVPAHVGIFGNENVDGLAKKGAAKNRIEVKVPFTKQELTHFMISDCHELWQFEWENSNKGRDLYQIQPTVENGFKIRNNICRKEEIILHQIRMGKCKLNYYMFLLKLHVDGMCDTCLIHETVEHYLLHCTRFEQERNIMKRKLKIIHLNLENLFSFSLRENYSTLLSYIRNTKRFEDKI